MDAKGDENNIKTITDAIAAYPGFRCLLILMKIQDKRLDSLSAVYVDYEIEDDEENDDKSKNILLGLKDK